MTAATLDTNLAGGNVTILSSMGATGTNGDIFVNDAITWASPTTLTLSAYRNIATNATITGTGGGNLVLRADNTGSDTGTVTLGAAVSLTGGSGTGNKVSIYYNPASYTDAATITTWTGTATTAATAGTGTITSPYSSKVTNGSLTSYMLVNNDADLQKLSTASTIGVYALGNDINGSSYSNPYENFQGILDGNGHTISNLKTGLFSSITKAIVRNLGLVDVNASDGGIAGTATNSLIDNSYVTGTVNGGGNTGGLVGTLTTSKISDSYSTAAVVGGQNTYAGGLVGQTTDSILDQDYSAGTVSGLLWRGGGLVGYDSSSGVGTKITNSYSTSAVSSSDGSTTSIVVYLGGLVGYGTNISIPNSYSAGSIGYPGGATHTGGLAGYLTATSAITGSYWNTDKSGQAYAVGTNAGSGNVAATGLTSAQMVKAANYADWDISGTGAGGGSMWYMIDGYTTPFLRWEYSTTIRNSHQLQLMAMDPTASYTLAGNLDMASYRMAPTVGFVPVGSSVSAFTGSFNGNDYTIRNLTISNYIGSADVGLFGYIGAGSSIHDVGLTNVSVSGGTGNSYVGALVGYNAGTVANTYVLGGSVSDSAAGADTGGIAGYNAGGITTSFALAAVSGSGNVGGLAGYNAATGSITTSYFSLLGTARGTGTADNVGGLAGKNSGAITTSYSSGTVSGSGNVAALVGTGGGTVTNSLSGANIATQATTAGWDLTNTWRVSDGGQLLLRWGNNTGLVITTVNDLLSIGTNLAGTYFLGNDLALTGTWAPLGTSSTSVFSGILYGDSHTISGLTISGSSLPAIGLFGYTNGAAISGLSLSGVNITGTAGTNQYVGGLAGYANNTVFSNDSVAGSVSGGGSASITASVGGLVGDNTGSAGLITGSSSAADVTATATGTQAGGLVGTDSSAQFIAISNSSSTGTVTDTAFGSNTVALGGLVGKNTYGGIDNSYSTATVTGNNGVFIGSMAIANSGGIGGLVGVNLDTVSNSYFGGAVTDNVGGSAAGGLVGGDSFGYGIVNSYTTAAATVVGTNTNASTSASYIGGLVGYVGDASVSVTGSRNAATVTAGNTTASTSTSNVGGVAGYVVTNGNIINSSNSGAISYSGIGTNYVGGVGGQILGIITGSSNSGVVTDTSSNSSYVGGLAGKSAAVSQSHNTGAVTGIFTGCGAYQIGGLGGYIATSIANSYNTGAVTVTANIPATTSGFSVYEGGLAGQGYRAVTSNSYNTGAVTATITSGSTSTANALYVGGFEGYSAGTTGSTTGNYSSGAVKVTLNSSAGTFNNYVGGLMGYNTGTTGSTTGNYSTGTATLNVTGSAGIYNNYVGGLMGYDSITSTGSTANSYSTGAATLDLSGSTGGTFTNYVGGLIGNVSANVSGAYSAGAIKVTTGAGSNTNHVGGLAGNVAASRTVANAYWNTDAAGATGVGSSLGTLANVTGLTTAQMVTQSSYTGLDFTNTWYMIDGYTYPFLRSEYSNTVTNAHQLQLMAMNLGATYSLAGNIDMTGYNMAPLVGFAAVGSSTTPFTGTFNGNDYQINGLTITGATGDVASLFGYTGSGATIHDIGLTTASVSGGAASNVGGLVGYNAAGSTVYNTYAIDTVSGAGSVGGLVGTNAGTVQTSFTDSTVTGSGAVGGLAGTNTGTVTDISYLGGTVSGTGSADTVGGLVGLNTGTIKTSYSGAGSVTGAAAGALVGANNGTVTDSVWNITVAASLPGIGSGTTTGATGLDSTQLGDKTNTAYANWDFTNTWMMSGGQPILVWSTTSGYLILNAAQLENISSNLGATYLLLANIDLTGDNWTPIGTSSSAFTGTLIGNGYTISGLDIENSTQASIGLFGYTGAGAKISNVNLTAVTVVGGASNQYVGGLVGYNGGTFANVSLSGNVSGSYAGGYVGGLAGYSSGTIANSYTTGTVMASGNAGHAGGLAGQNAGVISASYSAATVTASGTGAIAGGLAGLNSSSATTAISGSYFTGAVVGNGDNAVLGGLVGESDSGGIDGSYSKATVTVTANNAGSIAGGLVGLNKAAITNSYADSGSAVTASGASSYAGGLAGQTSGSIASSYSKAVVTASGSGSYAGGLAGQNSGSIASSYNSGAVTASGDGSYAGGLAGQNSGSIASSYNTGVVKVANVGAVYSYAGGLTGKNASGGSIATSYNTGAVTADGAGSSDVGGLAGYNAGTVATSYNTGAVTAGGSGSNVGGLAGENAGTIKTSYSVSAVSSSGANSNAGGLAGQNDAGGSIIDSFAFAGVNSSGATSNVGGLVGNNLGSLGTSYSVSAVSSSGTNSNAGGLIGTNAISGTVTNAIWNTDAAGQTSGIGSDLGTSTNVQGLTSAGMKSAANYAGWDLTGTWGALDGKAFPYLRWQYSFTPTDAIDGTVVNGGYGLTVEAFGTSKTFTGVTYDAAGDYYILVPDLLSATSQGTVGGPSLILAVAGNPDFRANSIYCSVSSSYDLYKDTLYFWSGGTGFNTVTAPTISDTSIANVATPARAIASGDLIYTVAVPAGYPAGYSGVNSPDRDLTVQGNLVATGLAWGGSSGAIAATGSITLDNTLNGTSSAEMAVNNYGNGTARTIFAGGDITIKVSGNLTIDDAQAYSGANSSSGTTVGYYDYTPRIVAGGNVTVVCGGEFINFFGPRAIEAGGRYLVYATQQKIYSADAYTFYTRHSANDTPDRIRVLNAVNESGELSYDTRGGLASDFVLWGTSYGDAVPDSGSGFIYTAANPLAQPLTSAQTMRQQAGGSAQAGGARWPSAVFTAGATDFSEQGSPLLTVVGKGVNLPADAISSN
ncbi:MAG: GLUG motif-containing protein [Negativicutes bacterium]|nr:GLUG motif-containing protein [Negativicutes bacterium]